MDVKTFVLIHREIAFINHQIETVSAKHFDLGIEGRQPTESELIGLNLKVYFLQDFKDALMRIAGYDDSGNANPFKLAETIIFYEDLVNAEKNTFVSVDKEPSNQFSTTSCNSTVLRGLIEILDKILN